MTAAATTSDLWQSTSRPRTLYNPLIKCWGDVGTMKNAPDAGHQRLCSAAGALAEQCITWLRMQRPYDFAACTSAATLAALVLFPRRHTAVTVPASVQL